MPRYSFLAECCWLMDPGLYLMFCSQQALIFIHFVNQFSSQHPSRISSFTTSHHVWPFQYIDNSWAGGGWRLHADCSRCRVWAHGHMGRGCGQLRSWSLISYDQWMVSGDLLLPARPSDAKFPCRDLWTSKWCDESHQISPSLVTITKWPDALYWTFKSTLVGGDKDEHRTTESSTNKCLIY